MLVTNMFSFSQMCSKSHFNQSFFFFFLSRLGGKELKLAEHTLLHSRPSPTRPFHCIINIFFSSISFEKHFMFSLLVHVYTISNHSHITITTHLYVFVFRFTNALPGSDVAHGDSHVNSTANGSQTRINPLPNDKILDATFELN